VQSGDKSSLEKMKTLRSKKKKLTTLKKAERSKWIVDSQLCKTNFLAPLLKVKFKRNVLEKRRILQHRKNISCILILGLLTLVSQEKNSVSLLPKLLKLRG
jgi:hypothetical protein